MARFIAIIEIVKEEDVEEIGPVANCPVHGLDCDCDCPYGQHAYATLSNAKAKLPVRQVARKRTRTVSAAKHIISAETPARLKERVSVLIGLVKDDDDISSAETRQRR